VTGSVDEVRAGLALVAEHLGSAGQYAARASTLIDDAAAVLARLSEQHHESLVPAELSRAADQLSRGRGLIEGGRVLVADIEARL
jgi:hypothetical protein